MLSTIYLLELTCYIDGTGETTLYYSDVGYVSGSADTPADTYFAPNLTNPGSLSRSIFANGTTFGSVEVGYGVITLVNADGELDALKDHGYGRSIVLKTITARNPTKEAYSTAEIRFSGVVSHVEANFEEIRLIIRDELELLDRPLQESRFDGTSTSTTGVEGNANVEGRVKPMAFGGSVRNISAVLANASNQIYSFNYDKNGNTASCVSVDALRNGGATYTLSGTDRADLAAMEATAPASAQADTCLAESLVRLNGSVTAGITLDATISPNVTNLLTYSEEFDNAAWTASNITVTANSTDAPDSNTTADTLSSTNTSNSLTHSAISITSSDAHAFTVYVKAGTAEYIMLEDSSNSFKGEFTLTGAGATSIVTGSPTLVIEALSGNFAGWYRCEMRYTSVGTTATLVLTVSDGAATGTTGTVFVWGAQLVESSAAEPYIATTSSAVTRRAEASPGRVAAAILAEHGYSIDHASLLALDSKNSNPVALYFDREITILQAAQQALEGIGGYLIADTLGNYRVGRFEAPTGTPVKAVEEWEIIDDVSQISLLATDDQNTGIPAYRVTMEFDQNYTVQGPGELTGSVSQDDRAKYAEQWFRYVSEDVSIQTKHPEAREITLQSHLTVEANAQSEATRRLTFLKSDLTRFKVPLSSAQAVRDADGSTSVDIGDYITLTMSRFGFSTATDFVIIGVEEDRQQGITFLDIVTSSAW